MWATAVDANIRVPALEKLLDYTASGVGSIAGSMLASWRARRESDAKRIAALGEADVLEITAQAHSKALRTTATAQAEARAILASSDTIIQGELDIAQTVSQRIQFQEEKRQSNIDAVVGKAALELGDKDVPDNETDHDWTARFFSEVQDVSSEEMQSLWAKVLAGEVERPGSTSIQTLSILKDLDQQTANLLRRLCSACVTIKPDGNLFIDARVPSLGGNPAQNALKDHGLSFDTLNVLNEHGLIIADYNSWFDFRACVDIHPSEPKQGNLLVIPFRFQERYWVLVPINQRDNKEFKLSGVALTRSGRELSSVVDLEPMDDYAQDLTRFFKAKNLQVTEVYSPLPRAV